MKNKVYIICGPTCSGKTKYSINLAKTIGAEIISADSMQIYKDMNIGTAKISYKEMNGIKHHMIDVVNFNSDFSVSQYKFMTYKIIDEIIKEKPVIIVGGTGLYINAILYDLSFSDTCKDSQLRSKLNEELLLNGKEYMYDRLVSLDPLTAAKLHVNDTKRVIRALEILEGGQNKIKNDETYKYTNKYEFDITVLNYDRKALYENINKRVDEMFNMGLTDEIAHLLEHGANFDCQSFQAIGYKEFRDYYNGNATIEDVKENIKKHTRNYAKRQLTWFKQYKDAKWINPMEIQ